MSDKPTGKPVPKADPKAAKKHGEAANAPAGDAPDPVKTDRPGFDLGGSTGKTHAGTGLGPGRDAAEDRDDRGLPRNRGKRP